jgi:hypothetical protein
VFAKSTQKDRQNTVSFFIKEIAMSIIPTSILLTFFLPLSIDLCHIQGTWRAVKHVFDSKLEIDAENYKRIIKAKFDSGRIIFTSVQDEKIETDEAKFFLFIRDSRKYIATQPGVRRINILYQFDKQILRMKLSDSTEPFPKDFRAKLGQSLVIEFEREKKMP